MLTPEVGSFWISKNNDNVKAQVAKIDNYGGEDHVIYHTWLKLDKHRSMRAMESNISVEAFVACFDPVVVSITDNRGK